MVTLHFERGFTLIPYETSTMIIKWPNDVVSPPSTMAPWLKHRGVFFIKSWDFMKILSVSPWYFFHVKQQIPHDIIPEISSNLESSWILGFNMYQFPIFLPIISWDSPWDWTSKHFLSSRRLRFEDMPLKVLHGILAEPGTVAVVGRKWCGGAGSLTLWRMVVMNPWKSMANGPMDG